MTRSVSNSEVVAFNICKHKYHLSFDLNLEPKRPGDALYRGTVGHAMLEAYYKTFIGLMPGQKTPEIWEAAEKSAWRVFSVYMSDADMDTAVMLTDLRRIMRDYFKYARNFEDRTMSNHNQRDWIILQVEKYYELDLVDDFKYVARLDLVARIDGKVTIIDHKFVYNFWTQDDLDLSPQLPKYTGIMRNNGIRVDRTMVNQIRYRVKKRAPFYTPQDMFHYSFNTPTDSEVQSHLREQIMTSRKIVRWREMSIEDRALNATRVLYQMVCKGCPVKSLCIMGLQGAELQNEISQKYQPNTYDYNTRALEEAVY